MERDCELLRDAAGDGQIGRTANSSEECKMSKELEITVCSPRCIFDESRACFHLGVIALCRCRGDEKAAWLSPALPAALILKMVTSPVAGCETPYRPMTSRTLRSLYAAHQAGTRGLAEVEVSSDRLDNIHLGSSPKNAPVLTAFLGAPKTVMTSSNGGQVGVVDGKLQ